MIAEDLKDKFGWPEYLVFAIMLAISAGIGIFYGCFGGKNKTTSEFLMANRNMATFPMAMSLIASFMSAITLLGTPAEMYQFGTQYWLIGISYFLVMASTVYLYLPVFFGLDNLTSVYEYLEHRFNKSVRLIGSAIFTLQMTIYMSIVVYAPSLALSQVTGIQVYLAVVLIYAVCIFYTALGGMKSVMVTDTFQVIIMFAAMVTVTIKGYVDEQSFERVWDIFEKGGRVEFFNLDFDPRVRHTVWGLIIGGYFTWLTIYAVNQSQVQRYLTVPTIRQAKIAIWINFFGLNGLLFICCFVGIVIYAKYADCHPIWTGRITTADQLFPLYVMETLGGIPGLPGLFVAGIFSGALSTVSSGLNSLAAICLSDFYLYFFPKTSDETATRVSKILSVVFGVISFGLVFVAEQLGGVLQAALSIFGMIGGPLLGLFSLGMFIPFANTIGAVLGTLISLGTMFFLGFGTNIAINRGELVIPKLNFSIEGCPSHYNYTIPEPNPGQEGGILEFYRISYIWYSFIGFSIVMIIGTLVSCITGDVRKAAKRVNPKLISPPILKLCKSIGVDYISKDEMKMRENNNKRVSINGFDNMNFQSDYNYKNSKSADTRF